MSEPAVSRLWAKTKAEIEERGYSKSMMNKTLNRMNEERRGWVRDFEQYIDHLICYREDVPLVEVVAKARMVATLKAAAIEERYPEGVILEEVTE